MATGTWSVYTSVAVPGGEGALLHFQTKQSCNLTDIWSNSTRLVMIMELVSWYGSIAGHPLHAAVSYPEYRVFCYYPAMAFRQSLPSYGFHSSHIIKTGTDTLHILYIY